MVADVSSEIFASWRWTSNWNSASDDDMKTALRRHHETAAQLTHSERICSVGEGAANFSNGILQYLKNCYEGPKNS